MRRNRLTFATLIVLACALVVPAGADAAWIEANPNWVTFQAGGAEDNRVTIQQAGTAITFTDAGASVDGAFAGCAQDAPGQVTCPLAGRQVKVKLEDRDDHATVTTSVRIKIEGDDGDDQITGTTGAQEIDGLNGNDVLSGGDGADTLDGGNGNDELNGGNGNDRLIGANEPDVLRGDGGNDTLEAGLSNDTLYGGADDDTLRGSNDDDDLYGEGGNDRLEGELAADLLDGGAGNDSLSGGHDPDTFTGGSGHDAVDWSDHTWPIKADFGAAPDGTDFWPESIPADVEELIGGTLADELHAAPTGTVLRGGPGADTLTGDEGNDALRGGDGDDVLDGAAGVDELYGDGDADRITSRDTLVEQIACGAGPDTALVDPLDVLAECETVDAGIKPDDSQPPAPGDGTPPGGDETGGGTGPAPDPELGRSVAVAPARGTVQVRTPGGKTSTLLAGDEIPVGSIVDTTRGAVALTSEADRSGKLQTAEFTGGIFQVRQPKTGRAPVTELVLTESLACETAKRGARRGRVAAARGPHGRKRRRLWGSGHGRFRTRGRRSSATVRGTVWMTEDRCDGTLTRVQRGVVAVKEFRTGKTVLVRAGKKHFAPGDALKGKRRAKRPRR